MANRIDKRASIYSMEQFYQKEPPLVSQALLTTESFALRNISRNVFTIADDIQEYANNTLFTSLFSSKLNIQSIKHQSIKMFIYLHI